MLKQRCREMDDTMMKEERRKDPNKGKDKHVLSAIWWLLTVLFVIPFLIFSNISVLFMFFQLTHLLIIVTTSS